MIIIEKHNKVIYRADPNKLLKIKGNPELYSEVVFKQRHDNRIEEVEDK